MNLSSTISNLLSNISSGFYNLVLCYSVLVSLFNPFHRFPFYSTEMPYLRHFLKGIILTYFSFKSLKVFNMSTLKTLINLKSGSFGVWFLLIVFFFVNMDCIFPFLFISSIILSKLWSIKSHYFYKYMHPCNHHHNQDSRLFYHHNMYLYASSQLVFIYYPVFRYLLS